MRLRVKSTYVTLLIMFVCSIANAAEIPVSSFSTEGFSGWESKIFKGKTEYVLVKDQNRTVLKAHAKGTASGLVKKISFDPKKYRYLKWSWKINDIIAKGDETRKDGDDYAARIYLVFPGKFFWQTKALNYIWANKLKQFEFVPSSYTANSMMLAVESGSDKAGRWTTEERDILSDYRRVFGEEPNDASAIAIMTDTDNTGSESTAWYSDISLSTK